MGSWGSVAAQRKGLCPGHSQSTHVQLPLENVVLKNRVAMPGLTQPCADCFRDFLWSPHTRPFLSARGQLWQYGKILFFLSSSSSSKESTPQKFRKYLKHVTLKNPVFKVI